MSYIYRHVELIRVVDGDTARLDIDMGNNIWWTGNFRLNGIDTPERGSEGFAAATEHLKELLSKGISYVQTFSPDKYGRWLVNIHIAVDGGDMLVNQMMINDGFAAPYFGAKRVP